ncbi:MAG: hypothetical protein HUJ26_08405 [Planctomycetaceae bacterium]|nr:hypothetical protein [Planctomycetaceae bacterium]
MTHWTKPSLPGPDDELNWLAFQYVAGEMTEAENEAFEERLLDDLVACEAVAAMSGLYDQFQDAVALSSAANTPSVVTPISGLRSWAAVGSTLAALAWLFALLTGTESDSVSSVVLNESEDVASLIAGWTGSDSEETLADDSTLNLNAFDLKDGTDPEIPGWMIAAVSLENASREMEEIIDEPLEMKEN